MSLSFQEVLQLQSAFEKLKGISPTAQQFVFEFFEAPAPKIESFAHKFQPLAVILWFLCRLTYFQKALSANY